MERWQGWTIGLVTSLMFWAILIGGTCALVTGCQRQSIRISPVIQGQKAPHSGYNIGPELWLEQGDSAKVTGFVLWIEGTDPNDLFGE